MPKYKIKIKNAQIVVRVKLTKAEELDQRQLSAVAGKRLRGLLKPTVLRPRRVEYTGPQATSLENYVNFPHSSYDFFNILAQLVRMEKRLNANAASLQQLVLELPYIFINSSTRELQFLFLPLRPERRTNSVPGVMEQIASRWKAEPALDLNYVPRFMGFLYSMQQYQPERVLEYIKREDSSVAAQLQDTSSKSGFITNKRADYYKHYEEKPQLAASSGGLDLDDTSLLTEPAQQAHLREDETSLLSLNQAASSGGGFAPLSRDEDEPETSLLGYGGYQSSRPQTPFRNDAPVQFNQPAQENRQAYHTTTQGPMPAWEASRPQGGYDNGFQNFSCDEQEYDTSLLDLSGPGAFRKPTQDSGFFDRAETRRQEALPQYQQDGSEGTELLQETPIRQTPMQRAYQYPYLIRRKTGMRVVINKPVFRIGKERSYVDFFIADNNAISRSHADIIQRRDRYYICDRNSTNKTYQNGHMLVPENEVEIFDGDVLRLANEEFEFHIN